MRKKGCLKVLKESLRGLGDSGDLLALEMGDKFTKVFHFRSYESFCS